MKRFIGILSVLLIVIGLFFFIEETPQTIKPHSGELVFQVFDVGHGDALLLRTERQTVLVDTGRREIEGVLISNLQKLGVEKIDILIFSHAHGDHTGNGAAIIEYFPVGKVYEGPGQPPSPLVKKYHDAMEKRGVSLVIPKAGDRIDLGGGAELEFLTPLPGFTAPEVKKNLNNSSIVARVTFGQIHMLLTGDMEEELENELVKKYPSKLQAQILKSPHHGSASSSTVPFLKAVRPEVALVSVSDKMAAEQYHIKIFKRYEEMGIKTYRTDTQDTITVRTDGKTYQIHTGKVGDLK
ncbi:MAG: MBL fold metallo-hydrolase [Negativicutes bacterium]|nr:MBL fold metallo-hydrolase [Negativicutes bacterium]